MFKSNICNLYYQSIFNS